MVLMLMVFGWFWDLGFAQGDFLFLALLKNLLGNMFLFFLGFLSKSKGWLLMVLFICCF